MTTQALHHPSRPLHRVLSRRLVVAAELLFTAGVSIGWVRYEHRSTTPLHHVPGSNAWWQHAAIAAVALAIAAMIWFGQRSGRIGRHVLLAPLSRSAAERIGLLYHRALWRPAAFARALAATPLLLVMMFFLFRGGFQVTSGIDPNATINAWGGPTYIGAMACHYLDGLLIMAAAAWLLNLLLPDRNSA